MKNRAPRKAKKQAKKLKSKHDSVIMAKTALSTALGAIQLASIASQPNPTFNPAWPAMKAISITQHCLTQAEVIKNILSEIKPWQEFVKPKMRHL